jgi:hypothetical protein
MATTTPNYGWDVPTSTDYVKDGAVAIETLGDDIDASMFAALSGKPAQGVLLNTTTVSAATTVTFSSVFSANYDNYQIIWNGNSSADQFLYLIFGATTSAYYSQIMDVRSNVGGPTLQAVIQNGASMIMNFNWTNGSTADALISNPFNAARTQMSSRFTSFTGSISSAGFAGGSLNNTTSYTACTITPSTGNFTGTFRVYGLRNS